MSKRIHFLAIVLGLVVAAGGATASRPAAADPTPVVAYRTTALSTSAARRLATHEWSGGSYTTSTGESVVVRVSTAYAGEPDAGRRWAEFFAALVHGVELADVRVYVATFAEVQEICGRHAIGCYGGAELVTIGDGSAGIAPTSVAAHEYGHHVAAYRANDPWRAIDWGTKRWATHMGICQRVRGGTAFPGNEADLYELNPGEGFAEAYRVFNETRGISAPFDWPIVDASFRPDLAAFEAIREDVLRPWSQARERVIRARFPGRSRTWTMRVATPLDGEIRVRLAAGGGADDVTLIVNDGRTNVVTTTWDGPGTKSLSYELCGVRSVTLRATRGGASSRFSVRVRVP